MGLSLVTAIFWVLLLFYRRETYRELRQVALIAGLFSVLLLQAGIVARSYTTHPEIVSALGVNVRLVMAWYCRCAGGSMNTRSGGSVTEPPYICTRRCSCASSSVATALSSHAAQRSGFCAPVLIIAAGYRRAVALGLAAVADRKSRCAVCSAR